MPAKKRQGPREAGLNCFGTKRWKKRMGWDTDGKMIGRRHKPQS